MTAVVMANTVISLVPRCRCPLPHPPGPGNLRSVFRVVFPFGGFHTDGTIQDVSSVSGFFHSAQLL